LESIRIKTSARLHLSLIDLNGARNRVDGSIGLAIQDPYFQILAQPSDRIEVCAQIYTERAGQVIQKLKDYYLIPGLRVQLTSEMPQHSGFGSGTHLALGIAAATNQIYQLGQSVHDLAVVVGRGGTSGVGVAAFEKGGFILDGGHKYPEQKSSFLPSAAVDGVAPPPLLLQSDFPDWQLLIIIPKCKHIAGDVEVNLFQTLCPQPKSTAERLSHLILMQMLPAIFEADLYTFGRALNEIQEFGWKRVEIDAQGGELQQTLDFLQQNGAIGAGVSSWGPGIVAVGDDIGTLFQRTQNFLANTPFGGDCFITRANNSGATIKRVNTTISDELSDRYREQV